jgi:hypothetical protein
MINFNGGSKQLNERNLSSERTINWYPEVFTDSGDDVKSKRVLVPCEGAESFYVNIAEDPTKYCRGLHLSSSGSAPDFSPRLYGVWGNGLFRFDVNLSNPQRVGDIADNGEPVSFANSNFEVVVADGESLWATRMDAPTGSASIRAVEMPYLPLDAVNRVKPTHVAFIGDRFYINNKQGNSFHFSKLLLGNVEFYTDVGALEFYSSKVASDPIVALAVVNGSLWIWGTRSLEMWREQNNQDDPLTYVGGSQTSIGCKAKYSVSVIGSYCFWLGSSDIGSDVVYIGDGNSSKPISGDIHEQIIKCQDRANAVGWSYADGSHIFYILTFRNSNRTFCFDVETGLWHERLKRDILSGQWLAYQYQYACRVGDYLYCGTAVTDTLCRLTKDRFLEFDGSQIVRQKITPTYYDDLYAIMIRDFVVDCNTGYTHLLQGQGSDPMILLEVSFDGGSSFGNVKPKSLGRQGEYKRQVKWNALGTGREVVFRLTLSDPISLTIYQARMNYLKCGK